MLDYDDPKVFDLLIDVCSRYQVEPSMPLESEVFFRALLSRYEGTPENLETWLDTQVRASFLAVNARPRWIQGADWPFVDGKPMFFVGQIDIRVNTGSQASQFFHDDTSFYVFMQKKGSIKVIVQQF